MQILQFSDSAFPVGTFSFSNGLETAGHEHIVHDAATLEAFSRSQAWQAAYTDGIAAIHAFRAAKEGNTEEVMHADRELLACKMNDEARLMLSRMGKKLAELAVRIFENHEAEMFQTLLDAVNNGHTPGCYPVMQGVLFALSGMSESELFASHQYGVINMVVSAALRSIRVSHYDTQRILMHLSRETPALYADVTKCELKDMNAFFPQLDIIASLHEKGMMRMFMN